jgi:hypothetical protein
MVKRASVGGRVETFADDRNLVQLAGVGYANELDYLTTEGERVAAEDLAAELMLDALAGVDLRARLVGEAIERYSSATDCRSL